MLQALKVLGFSSCLIGYSMAGNYEYFPFEANPYRISGDGDAKIVPAELIQSRTGLNYIAGQYCSHHTKATNRNDSPMLGVVILTNMIETDIANENIQNNEHGQNGMYMWTILCKEGICAMNTEGNIFCEPFPYEFLPMKIDEIEQDRIV